MHQSNWEADDVAKRMVTLLRLMVANSSRYMFIIDLVWHFARFSNLIRFFRRRCGFCVRGLCWIIRSIWIAVKMWMQRYNDIHHLADRHQSIDGHLWVHWNWKRHLSCSIIRWYQNERSLFVRQNKNQIWLLKQPHWRVNFVVACHCWLCKRVTVWRFQTAAIQLPACECLLLIHLLRLVKIHVTKTFWIIAMW